MFQKITEKLYTWYGKRTVRIVAAITVVLIVIVFTSGGNATPASEEQVSVKEVKVATPASISGSGELSLIGTVEAKTQAKLSSESTGRIVSVSVALGQEILPGTIIAQLENATERASVLQAEGAYEAALAGASQGTLGVSGAENALQATKNTIVATHASTYTTVSGIVGTTIDQFFSSPEGTVPGLKIDGRGYTTSLNSNRVILQTSLPAWQLKATSLTPEANLTSALEDALSTTETVLTIVDELLAALTDANRGNRYTDEEYRAFVTELTSSRGLLVAAKGSLTSAGTDLKAAEDALLKAEIAGTSAASAPSLAEAQVKQALGVLRAAEANLAKTIVRSPIMGTVNSLYVRAGDFVGMNTPVAEVANNNGLEVTTYIGETEAINLNLGDEVWLGDTATGTITSISPAINNATGKVEVRIGTAASDLKTGSTVNVKIRTTSSREDARVMVPLTAIKLTTDAALVFTVSNEGVLTAVPVVLGAVSGELVEVVSGVANDTAIVLDVRGRKAGETVTVAK